MFKSVSEFMAALAAQLRRDADWWTERAKGEYERPFTNAAGKANYLATEIETKQYSDDLALSLFTLNNDERTFPAVDRARIEVTMSLTQGSAHDYGEVNDFLSEIMKPMRRVA